MHRNKRRVGRWPLAIVVILATLGAPLVPSVQAASDYTRSSANLPPLANSYTYEVVGRWTKAGCEFVEGELLLPDGWKVIERRDIAIDFKHCRKIIEEGVPSAGPGGRLFGAPLASPESSAISTTSATFWKQGYHAVWFEDVLGLMVNLAETDIKWFYSAGCVTDGFGNGGASGAGWSGWEFVSGNYTHSQTCSSFVGNTVATMKNPSFCSPVTVWAYYYMVKATGYSNGTIGGTNSADVVNECIGLTKRQQTAIVASGIGGP